MAGPTHKTTESGKKHAFKSFKERVDTLKIEPARKLNTRAYDYVETSHFLVTLQHWREVNLSGDFTEFLFEVEKFCQTLPQILHHQERLFKSLVSHIEKNDINSLQPLLELVTQFIHDLGPDFMPFYIDYLRLILSLTQKSNPNDSQNMKNTSNVLEWSFNSMAFAFKYLARYLVNDLTLTFREILPTLAVTKKTYVSRFCAEAFSFLVKKLKQDALQGIIDFSLNQHRSELEENAYYRESLAILYGESMKNTSETFHSKASLVLSELLSSALDSKKGGDAQITTVCDTLLQVLQHGSIDSCEKFFNLCMNTFEDVIRTTDSFECLLNILSLLITISFSESGKKVLDWLRLLDVAKCLLAKGEFLSGTSKLPFPILASTAQLFSIVVRNSNVQSLNKSFHYMADYLSTRSECRFFLSFYELSLLSCKERLKTFGINKYLQAVVNKMTAEEEMLSVARFLVKFEEHPECDFSTLVIPSITLDRLISAIKIEGKASDESSVLKIYWRLRLASYAPSRHFDFQDLLAIFRVINSSPLLNSALISASRGLVLGLAIRVSRGAIEHSKVFELVKDTIGESKQSTEYVRSLKKLFDSWKEKDTTFLASDFEGIALQLATNLSTPNRNLRRATIDCLASVYKLIQAPFPSFMLSIQLIDQIPLEVSNANDIKLRIRVCFDEFIAHESTREAENLIFVNFIIGLLSNSFRPCWLSVYESLPKLAQSTCTDALWGLFMKFLNMNFKDQTCEFPNTFFVGSSESAETHFETSDERLNSNIKVAKSTVFRTAEEYLASIFEDAKELFDLSHKSTLRSRIIEAMQAAVFISEKHGSDLIEFVHELYEISGEDSDEINDWTAKDKLLLLTTFAKFKSLRKVKGNDVLFALILENLSSRLPDVQRESLNVVFAWNISEINKYKDSLKNLLEDKLFRDELQLLVNKESDSKIEDADRAQVIPIVLRILYGRAKGVTNNNSKNSRKFAIASVLPNLPDDYIVQFLFITSEKIPFSKYFNSKELFPASTRDLRNMLGYLNLLFEVYNGLGYKFAHLLKGTVQPLIFTLVTAQQTIDSHHESDLLSKQARIIRQLGLKCLNHFFKISSGLFDWSEYSDLIFSSVVRPRLQNFAQENLQQLSALMLVMLGWMESEALLPFLYHDNFAPVTALMELLAHQHTKDVVRSHVLDFCISALTKKNVDDERFVTVLAMIVDSLLSYLPVIIEESQNRDINSRSATLLLLVIEGNFINDQTIMKRLVDSCAGALDKPPTQIATNDKISILLSLIPIIENLQCSFQDIEGLYECCSKALRIYLDRNVRECLVKIFGAIGSKFPEYKKVGELLISLNSYSPARLSEPDFERRLDAFKAINEVHSNDFSAREWMPVIYCCLFFLNDPEELVLRSNAATIITTYIDCVSTESSLDAEVSSSFLHGVIIPHIRKGLKNELEVVRDGYVTILSHLVRYYNLTDEFTSMKVLLSDDDDCDFFKNFSHIQLSSRLNAIRQLLDLKSHLSLNAIYFYVLPMTEVYTICQEDRYRELTDETSILWSHLVRSLKWEHFRQLFKKKIAALTKVLPHELKDSVQLVISLSKGLLESIRSLRKEGKCESFENLPAETKILDKQIMTEFYDPILKTLNIKDEGTLRNRTALLEAAINCLLCTSDTIAEAAISGTLTSTCQALRSKSQSVRDTVRGQLAKITSILGAKYFKFIIKELKSALIRGSHLHILSFTLHAIMESARECFTCGDLDESATLIVNIIMEDIFGASGSEKDEAGYTSKMKEVKSKTGNETARILSSLITLPQFHFLIEPIKLLLREHLPLKTQKKLDELIISYSSGLQKNPNSSKIDILILCYELYSQSRSSEIENSNATNDVKVDDHHLVKLNSKPLKINVDKSQSQYTIQRLSFSLLRSALVKHEALLTASNLDGLLPNLESSLEAEDERLLVSVFRVLDLVAKLQFPSSRDAFFEKTALRAFEIIQNMPSTSNELCQVCLQYVATIVAYRGTVEISDTAIVYLLVKIMPDLENPDRQRRAFNFLKAIVSQHVMLPEVYEIMEKVSTIMIVNHNKTIRAESRSLYFQFLMEYEHSSTKLDKSFKFLVNNLEYPTQSGRQSVLELMHSIVLEAPHSLLEQLATSFFVGLANLVVSDDSLTCREMASILIAEIFKKLNKDETAQMEAFCYSWITQESNSLLKRCGLIVYKLFATTRGFETNSKLDSAALHSILKIISSTRSGCKENEADWEMIYTAMNVFASLRDYHGTDIFAKDYEVVWMSLADSLLFPHSWVRYLSSRLIGSLLENLDDLSFEVTDQQIQIIAYRLLKQLNASGISQKLAQQAVKNLIKIVSRWEAKETPFLHTANFDKTQPAVKDGETSVYKLATDFVLSKMRALMRLNSLTENDFIAKLAAIQLGAMISQIASPERLTFIAKELISGLFIILESNPDTDEERELNTMAKECLRIMEERLDVSEFGEIHLAVKLEIERKRLERRSQRAQLTISDPELAAEKRIKRNQKAKQKRKLAGHGTEDHKAKKKRTAE